MPCTVPSSKASKVSVASKKPAATYIELIFCLLIVGLLLIPIGLGVKTFSQTFQQDDEAVLLTAIRTDINRVSAESLFFLKESEIVYNKGEQLEGFTFSGALKIKFTHYGQIKKGGAVLLRIGEDIYRLTIRPVTGVVSLKKER